jgi:hypothetical protein
MRIVVADLFQLGRDGGSFNSEIKNKVLHAKAKVQESYVEEINAGSADSGRFYVVDEEATKEFYETKARKKELIEAKNEAEKLSKEDLLNSIVEKKTSQTSRRAKRDTDEI